jgi:glutamyl/glutaminyl-tRNA synthetase
MEHFIALPASPVISRLAPTPSGYLHLGNAVNFILTWALVRSAGGKLLLRIDNVDPDRTLPEYVEDIFVTLEWLKIDYDLGPGGPEEFGRDYSILRRKEYYRDLLEELRRNSDRLYACSCSRKQIAAASPSGIYPGTCRRKGLLLETRKSAMRLIVPEGTSIRVGSRTIALDRDLGDFVLWRKDGAPAYQFSSLVDDRDWGINLIVRGEDLLLSTAAQLYIARLLGAENFLNARFIHHPLLIGSHGEKLSKVRRDHSLKELRESGKSPLFVYRYVAGFLGIDPKKIGSIQDFIPLVKKLPFYMALSQ